MWLTAVILASHTLLLSLSSSLTHCVSELSQQFLENWQKASSRGTAETGGIPSFAPCSGYRLWSSSLANDTEITRSTSSGDGSSHPCAKVPAGGRMRCHIHHISEVDSTSSAWCLCCMESTGEALQAQKDTAGDPPSAPHCDSSLRSLPGLSPGRLLHIQWPLISELKDKSSSLLKGTRKGLSFKNSAFVGFFLLVCVCLILRLGIHTKKIIVRIFLYPEPEVYIFHLIFLEIAETVAWENCTFSDKKEESFHGSDLKKFTLSLNICAKV